MKKVISGFIVMTVCAFLVGCGSNTQAEGSKADFSNESFEKAMKESGREKELEDYKKLEAQHNQDAGQGGSQPAPAEPSPAPKSPTPSGN
ncbi:MAG: hypothetical protein JST40_07850 [Armatimonadetes bacterium]|nr:hypothetical protein [Armatimonadota bacterium]